MNSHKLNFPLHHHHVWLWIRIYIIIISYLIKSTLQKPALFHKNIHINAVHLHFNLIKIYAELSSREETHLFWVILHYAIIASQVDERHFLCPMVKESSGEWDLLQPPGLNSVGWDCWPKGWGCHPVIESIIHLWLKFAKDLPSLFGGYTRKLFLTTKLIPLHSADVHLRLYPQLHVPKPHFVTIFPSRYGLPGLANCIYRG